MFAFLLSRRELGLIDVTKAQITTDSVRLNYVHGIWYEVRPADGSQQPSQQLLSCITTKSWLHKEKLVAASVF